MRLALLLALSLALVACDSTDDAGGEACAALGLTSTGSMTATAPGGSFRAACVTGQATGNSIALGGLENVDGSAGATQRQINISVFGASPGDYAVGGAGLGAVVTYADVDLANPAAGTFAGTSGTVTVDEASPTGASGSFSFQARNNAGQTVTVSGGSFEITF